MLRFRASLLLLSLAALSLAQVSSQFLTPEIRRVGSKLACLCGACKNTVADCPMLECHYASPARQKIARLQAEGKSDQEIIDVFVKEQGLKALAVPPAEGFNLFAWLTPFAAIGAGLLAIWWFIKRMIRKPEPLAEVDARLLDRYHETIEEDLSKLDS